MSRSILKFTFVIFIICGIPFLKDPYSYKVKNGLSFSENKIIRKLIIQKIVDSENTGVLGQKL